MLHESFLPTYHYETGRFILDQQRRMAGCYQGQVQEKSENSFLGWVGSLDTFPDIFDNGNNFWAFSPLDNRRFCLLLDAIFICTCVRLVGSKI